MKNRLLHNMLAVIALGLMAQEVSAGSHWQSNIQRASYSPWGRTMQSNVFPARTGVSSTQVIAPAINPAAIHAAEEAIGQNVLRAAQQATPTSSNVSDIVQQAAPVPTGWFSGWSRPSMETVKSAPANVWSGITSRAGSIYEMRPKTMEEAGKMARALPGQVWSSMKATPGITQTGLATYAGRPVMSAGSSIGSAGSWLGSQLGEAWRSYAPQTAQQYAGQVGSGVGSAGSWLGGQIGSGLSSAASYAPQTVQGYTGQAYNWLAGMTEEQKQAAVGLAAVIAAGLAAKKGYDYYRGPSAYSEFKEAINEAIAPMLIDYTLLPRNELMLKIGNSISAYINMINGAVSAKTLSQPEAASLIANLMRMKVQLGIIENISQQITALNKSYDHNNATGLFDGIAKSAHLTPEQKNILREKVTFIFEANQPKQ